jgi:hypothetical protein
MRLAPPQQLSSVPEINDGAMGWAGTLVDMLGQIGITQLRIGTASVTFPGGSSISNTLNVPHGIVSQGGNIVRPKVVLATQNQSGTAATFCSAIAGAPGTVGTFQLAAQTIDGSFPAVGTTAGFDWLAAN